VPAIQACIIAPIWDQVLDLLPPRQDDHPLGCHRPRVSDRLVFGGAYWRHAATILPSVTPVIASSTRSEELNSWRRPIDLIALLEPVFERLDDVFGQTGTNADWRVPEDLIATMLGDDPEAIVEALTGALELGASPTLVSQTVVYAAALRVTHFHTSNEFSDWITVLHTFTYTNATHRLMRRAPSAELVRAVYHGAIRVYLDRFLNMPAARLPEHRRSMPYRPKEMSCSISFATRSIASSRSNSPGISRGATWRSAMIPRR